MKDPLDLLKEYWGHSKFRNPQEEIINSVLNGQDTIALLPTGGGKSVCFQIPILTKPGLCVVISPLIALMNDQIKGLKKKNIKALALTSKMSQGELITTFDNLKFGNYKFLYLSPEKLQTPLILEKLKQLNVQLIAIDEAHCISEWGHDFRPSYLQINNLTDLFPKTPTIALTASATKEVVKDIVKYLDFKEPQIFKKSYARNNLAYLILDIEDKLFQVEKILKKTDGVIIIYVNTRKRTIEVSQQLNSLGHNSCFYHGGMNYEEKENAYELWLSEKKPIIVATNAFGMGIDKPNVRVVVHYDFPKSVENYMQEAGRAGRDGRKSFSVVLKNKTDIDRTRSIFEKTVASVPFIKEVYFKLNQYYRISKGELLEKSFEFNLSEFCALYKFPMVTTFNALSVLESEGILLMHENSNRKSTVIFKAQNHILFDYYERNPSHEKLIKLLLRTYGGIFDNYISINENHLCSSLGLSQNELTQKLKDLHNDNILLFYNSKVLIHIQFLVPREDDRTINSHSRNIENRNLLKKGKIDKMIAFIENKNICRNIQLLYYFDESNPKECGICDVCLSKKKQIPVDYKKMTADVLEVISSSTVCTSKELALALEYSEKDILFCLQILLEKNRIRLTLQNKFRLVE